MGNEFLHALATEEGRPANATWKSTTTAPVARPLPEISDAVVALTEKASAMMEEVRSGLIWKILTYKLPKET